jgi:hypothetical protein
MANIRTTLEVECPKPFLPFSHANTRAAKQESSLEQWTDKWAALKQCRQTNLFIPKPDLLLSKNLLWLSKDLWLSKKDLGLIIDPKLFWF